ncbi:MAG: T9SS type B sorting domain-containing protein [Saprospiraceae bacterium]
MSDSSYELIVVVERDGCYGADTVLVAVAIPVVTEQHAALCAGDSLAFLGAILTQAGRYEFPLNGCDSTLALNLVVAPLPEKTASFALCPGDSVYVGDTWLTGAGVYAVRVSANGGGCDTVFRVSISETPAVFNSQTITICAGDSVAVFGQWVAAPAVLSQTFASAAGCDSVQEIRVLVAPLPEKTVSFALCPGDSVRVGDTWLTGAGTYAVRISAIGGDCDTVCRVAVSELPANFQTDTLTLCPGDSVWINNQWVGEASELTLTLVGANGCDSMHTLSIQVPGAPPPPALGDTTLRRGQNLTLDLALDPAEWSVQWFPSAIFSCDTCPRTVVRPVAAATAVEVVYTNRAGCAFSHRFLIVLKKMPDLYVPNIFSPNDDGSNDHWTVIAPPEIGTLEEVSVWSRWGELLALWHGVARVDWDGTFRGAPLDAGVFVYSIRYRDVDGEMQEQKGDVTLVR